MTTVLFVVLMTACGSDAVGPAATSTGSTISEPTTTTTITTTTSTSTTTAPATTAPVTAVGWSDVAMESLPSKAFPPCCADTWHGDVSPPLTPDGQPLADGAYAVDLQWPQDPTQPLELELSRFEQCALLPEFSCEPQSDPYLPDQLGIDTSASRALNLVLDDTVEVVVVGWNDAPLESEPVVIDGKVVSDFVIEKASGAEFAALATEVDEAYAAVFADRFVAGESPDAIIADVLANPTSGFSPSVRGNSAFVFTPESGPPLLFQQVFPYISGLDPGNGQRTAGRGTDVLPIRSIDVVDGRVTLYVYSGYSP
jgi:hypothetical protein